MPPTASGVTLTIDQQEEHYAGDARRGIHAKLTIRTRGLGDGRAGSGEASRTAEVIVIDFSESMMYPRSKIDAAQQAASRALAALRHGTRFAVVQGTHHAEVIYPAGEALAIADSATIREAQRRIRHGYPNGGTAIGAWLRQARRLLEGCEAEIRHVMLLTDGRNEHQRELLTTELDACDGLFTCDTWGIGHDYDKRELRLVADRLHGVADIALDGAELAAGFEEATRTSMTRTIPSLPIRITLTLGTEIRYLRQTHPRERDLTDDRRPVAGEQHTVEFPTQPWSGDDEREYLLCVTVDPASHPMGEDLRLGMVEVATAPGWGPAPEPVPLVVHWLPGEGGGSTMLAPPSRPYELHQQLGLAVHRGCEAFAREDRAAAEDAFCEAVRLAHLVRDRRMQNLLADFMVIDDAAAGEARLRQDLDPRRLDRIWVQSTTHPEAVSEPTAARGLLRRCPCGALFPQGARYCQPCGKATGS